MVMSMRVIAGKAKGRKLKAPKGDSVRPTSDKVKGAVFSMLAQYAPLGNFLDLFAGSGAMGIEAWSRGATGVVFVEKDRKAFEVLRSNLQTVGFSEAALICADWQVGLRRLAGEQFAFIYVDPPFFADLYPAVLASLRELEMLSHNGILCLEHSKRQLLSYDDSWSLLKTRHYGETAVTFLTLAGI